jgi:competence protein ComEC
MSASSAGVVFAALRLLLAVTGAALHVDAKKIAAVGGILAAFLYMLLTGSQVPMQRAVAMAGLFALAVLLDRQGAGMRALALAAIVVLALQPEALLGPSFQMSFAAVLALIAAYQACRPWLTRVRAARGWPLRLARACTSLLHLPGRLCSDRAISACTSSALPCTDRGQRIAVRSPRSL